MLFVCIRKVQYTCMLVVYLKCIGTNLYLPLVCVVQSFDGVQMLLL